MYHKSLAITLLLCFGVFLGCAKQAAPPKQAPIQPGDAVRKDYSSRKDMVQITGLRVPEDLPNIVRKTNLSSKRLAAGASTSAANPVLRAAINHPAFCDAEAEVVDFRTLGLVSPIKDQNVDSNNNPVECGSCWAFATNAVVESSYLALRKENINASEQELISCSSAGSCEGGWWAFDFLWRPGIESGINYKYDGKDSPCRTPINVEFRVVQTGYVSQAVRNAEDLIPSDSELKSAMCQHGPLAVGINATPAFVLFGAEQHDAQSVFSEKDSGYPNHAIVLVGWNRNGWIIKNSWGPGWGQNGFAIVKYGSNSVGLGAAWAEAWPKDYVLSPSIRNIITNATKETAKE